MKKLLVILLLTISYNLMAEIKDMKIEGAIESDIIFPNLNKGDTLIIVINSPGGRMDSMYRALATIDKEKKKGVLINCIVSEMAASAAFVIFSHCSNRFAFNKSLLLWHGPQLGYMGYLNTSSAANLALLMEKYSEEMYYMLYPLVGIPEKIFAEYYYSDRFMLGEALDRYNPKFLTLITSEYLKYIEPNAGTSLHIFEKFLEQLQ